VLSSAKTEMLHCSGEPGNFKPSIYLSLHTFLTNDSKHKTYNNGEDRKDHYKFGIDFVECIKMIGFKIGNNIRQGDI
jgi:hypothetical protein